MIQNPGFPAAERQAGDLPPKKVADVLPWGVAPDVWDVYEHPGPKQGPTHAEVRYIGGDHWSTLPQEGKSQPALPSAFTQSSLRPLWLI